MVKSPAGAEIEIVDDRDWTLSAGVELRAISMWQQSKPLIVRDLFEYGPVTNKSGAATSDLWDRIEAHYPRSVYKLGDPVAFSQFVKQPANAPAFERDTRAKRTYSIKLVAMPQMWYDKMQMDIEASNRIARLNGTRPPEVAPPPIEAPPEETITDEEIDRLLDIEPPEQAPSIEVEIASQVAMQLLTTVVEIISAGSSGDSNLELRKLRNELVHSQTLLAQRLEENERMRRQNRVTGDELRAVKLERDSLRQRLRQTEANLNSALKGDSAQAVTTEVMKRVDRIMRATPNAKGE